MDEPTPPQRPAKVVARKTSVDTAGFPAVVTGNFTPAQLDRAGIKASRKSPRRPNRTRPLESNGNAGSVD